MSKIGDWLAPNWYHDWGLSKREILELRRAAWRQRQKVKNARRRGLAA